MEISALNKSIRTNLLLLLLLFNTVNQTGANSNSSILNKSRNFDEDDTSWINSNFPIAADSYSIANLSEQCLQDTMTQLAALRDRLPWAVESKN